MTDFYHVCFAVPDLDEAMHDFSRVAGLQWCTPAAGTLGEWDYRIVFSRSLPHIELIEGPPESPWDSTNGPRFDHLGWWADSVEATSQRLRQQGLPTDFDACPYGRSFVYHWMPSIGARVEIVDIAAQTGFLETWNPGGDTMPSLPD